jgi:hypothetical protein
MLELMGLNNMLHHLMDLDLYKSESEFLKFHK